MTTRQDDIKIADIGDEHQALMIAARDQMQLVLVGMLGGRVEIPVKTLDDYPIGRGLALKAEGDNLVLELVETPNTITELPGD